MEERRAVDDQVAPADIAAVYDQHREGLVRFATVLVGVDAAQDVVSAALLRLLERPRKIRNPKSYLFQAVANQAKNHNRHEGRRRVREERTAPAGYTTVPEPYPEVREAIVGLSTRQRAVVYLTYWEDLTESTVAQHLGISVGSVRTHLHRARRHLRRVLHAYEH